MLTSDPGYFAGRFIQFVNWTVSKQKLRRLISYVMDYPPDESLDAAVSLLSKPRIIRQALALGKEEMYRIGPELEPEDIKGFWDESNGYRIWAFFITDDHWVPPAVRAAVAKTYGNEPHIDVEVMTEESPKQIMHAFCVRHSDDVAIKTVAQIKKSLDTVA